MNKRARFYGLTHKMFYALNASLHEVLKAGASRSRNNNIKEKRISRKLSPVSRLLFLRSGVTKDATFREVTDFLYP